MTPEPTPQPAPPGTWPKAIPLLILVGLLAYANSFTKAFVLDDTLWIANNPDLANDTSHYLRGMDRPVISLTIVANYKLGGLNPVGYHALNLAVHLLAGLTLYGLVRRVLLQPRFEGRYDGSAPYLAFAVALLWLVHPLQTQAVTYVIQRCESMMGLFYLFALYAWLRGATGGKRWWYPAAVASFALSCGCKEVAVTLPVMLLVFDRVFLASSWRQLCRERWLPYLGILAVWAVKVAVTARDAFGGSANVGIGFDIQTATPFQYLLTQAGVILHYLRLSVWPVGQAMDYVDWPIATSLKQVWPAFTVVSLLLLGSLALLYYRPALGFVGFWFFGILAPTSSIVPIIDPVFEHRMYLSLAAVVVLAVLGVEMILRATNWPGRKQALFGATLLGAAAAMLTARTFARNEQYRSLQAVLEHDTVVRPNNPRPWVSLASVYINSGELDRATEALDRGQAVQQRFDIATRQRAPLLALQGRLVESEATFRKLMAGPPLAIGPIVHQIYTWVLIARGKPGEAADVARNLVEQYPYVADFQMLLAAAALAAGRDDQARAAAAEAARLKPASVQEFATDARTFTLAPVSEATPFFKPRAMWMAAAACLADGNRDPKMLDTLAMAAAWNGQFARATDAARRGIAAAEAAGDPDWTAALRSRLKLYEAGKPYRHGD